MSEIDIKKLKKLNLHPDADQKAPIRNRSRIDMVFYSLSEKQKPDDLATRNRATNILQQFRASSHLTNM